VSVDWVYTGRRQLLVASGLGMVMAQLERAWRWQLSASRIARCVDGGQLELHTCLPVVTRVCLLFLCSIETLQT
jgi:hypothetical protein